VLRPFAAVISVLVLHVAVNVWAALPGIDDSGPSIPCMGRVLADGNRCQTAWGDWSALMYAPEIGLVVAAIVAVFLRRH
jgi:hypothetical protein